MIITSDSESTSSNTDYSKTTAFVSAIFYIIMTVIILSMSYGNITPDYYVVIFLYSISLIIANINYSKMSGDYLERLQSNPYTVIIQELPIVGVIIIILTFLMLGTLIVGCMFAWEFYIVYMIVGYIISTTHKKRLGIK